MVRGALAVVLALVAGCNSLLGIEDLSLVDAPPPDARVMFEVQEGVADYNLTKDTFITAMEPTTPHGDAEDLSWTTTNNVHALLRFDDLFGVGGLPADSTIQKATLEVEVLEAGSAVGQLYEVASDWDEATTYNNFGANVGVSSEDRGVQVFGTLDGSALGKARIEVTQSVEDWRRNLRPNKGWLFVPADATVVRIGSSDDPDIGHHPKLIVEIVP